MATHQQNISNLENAVLGSEVRQSMIELFNEDYALVKKAVGIGTDISSPTSSTTGYYDGNLYINNSTMDIWEMDGTGWHTVGNLKTISSINVTESSADDGNNEVIVNFSDGTTQRFNVKNGSKGSTGYGITGAVDDGNGEFHLTISNGSSTAKIKTVKGDKGDQGQTGPAGPSGRDVTSITMTGTGKQHPVTAYYSDGTASTIGILQDGADGSGGGDMYKATYDINDVGYVDKAAALTDGTNVIPCSAVATKSTSLAGYGIADAYTKTEVNTIVGDLDATDIEYSTGVTVKDKIDGLNATNLEYSTGVSIKSKIDELSTDIVIADDSTAWTSDGTYVVGNTRIYQQKAYECILACDGSVLPTNTTYWKELTLSDLAGEVNELKSTLIPTQNGYTAPTMVTANATYVNGGYIKVGKLVVVNIWIKTVSAYNSLATIATGLPRGYNVTECYTVRGDNDTHTSEYALILADGTMKIKNVIAGTAYSISCVYLIRD